MNGNVKYLVFGVYVALLMLGASVDAASATAWYVDTPEGDVPYSFIDIIRGGLDINQTSKPVHNIDTGEDFAMIQAAIDDVDTHDGHTITVDAGTYYENVDVNKRLTIKSENGSDKTIVHAENPNDHVFDVTTDYVNISGFTLKESYNAGMYLYHADCCNISNNNCSSNFDGIYLSNSNNNVISQNIISNNIFYVSGVHLSSSNSNTIVKNDILNNDHGIYLSSSNNNLIYHNNFIDNINSVYSSDSTNTRNSTAPVTYTYNGNQYTNYLGNYWDDHTGADADGDGIIDTTYGIDGDEDTCPLVQPFENYLTEEQNEIKFRGTAIEYQCLIGAYHWNVSVDELISGPQPCNDKLNVITWWSAPPGPPWGYVDPNIEEGDKIEVYGKYRDEYGCYVVLEGSEDYYIKKSAIVDAEFVTDGWPDCCNVSNGTYQPGDIVRASCRVKNMGSAQARFVVVFNVSAPDDTIYSKTSRYETILPGRRHSFLADMDDLLLRIPLDANTGFYDVKLEVKGYGTGETYDTWPSSGWKENQFKIESSEVPGWSEDIRITNDSADSINPRIAVDSNNDVHIVWEDNRDGNYWVYYTKLDNQGNTLIDDKKIVSLPFIGSNELFTYDAPSIAVDSDDDIHLAFIEYVDSAIYEIFYVKLDNNGNVLSDVKRVDNSLTLKRSPDIVVDSDNNVHIVWEDYTDYPTEVYYSKLDSSGDILINSERLTHDTKASGFPKIAVNSSNNIHVVSGGASDYYFPDISIDSNDNIHNVWCSEGAPQWLIPPGIYYKKLDKNGGTVIYSKLIIDSDTATRPAIAIDSNDNVHVIWIDSREIYYSKLDNAGDKLINDMQLTFDPASPWKPDIAIDSNDKVHITWQDDRDGNWEIYYKTNATGQKITKGWPMFRRNQRHTGYSISTAPNNNNVAWIFETEEKLTSSPAVANNKVFVGSDDGKIYCLDESTGNLIWSYQTGDLARSSPAVANGKIFVGSRDHKIYCINESTGNLIWSYETGDWVDSSPAVVNGSVFIGSKDYNIYCLDENTGQRIWNRGTSGQVFSSPAVADGVIYIGDNYGKIYALREDDGELIWAYTTRGSIESSPAVVNGQVYVGSFSLDYFYCFDVSGNLLWVSSDIGSTVTSSPGVANGKVFVGSRDNKIYCLNETNGDLIWSYETADCVDSSPAIADGKVFVGSYDNKIYVLDEDTGELVWSYETGDGVWSSPAVADGTVFVGSNDGKIYAFGESVGPKMIEVDDDFVDDPPNHKWDTIQEGVSDANNGDTVLVYSGTYHENVKINKRLTIRSENGADSTIVQAANPDYHVFEVTADDVNISGFTFEGATSGCAIYLDNIQWCKIYNSNCSGHWAIVLVNSSNNTIIGNNCSNNDVGIYLWNSSNNTLAGNNASNNWIGIELGSSSNNTFTENVLLKNGWNGVYLQGTSSNNLLYHNNFIDNTACDSGTLNQWNDTYPSGGNYWSDYEEKYSDAKEIDESGIWDTPYDVPCGTGARDNYPLMGHWENYITVPQIDSVEILNVNDIPINIFSPGDTVKIKVTVSNPSQNRAYQVSVSMNIDEDIDESNGAIYDSHLTGEDWDAGLHIGDQDSYTWSWTVPSKPEAVSMYHVAVGIHDQSNYDICYDCPGYKEYFEVWLFDEGLFWPIRPHTEGHPINLFYGDYDNIFHEGIDIPCDVGTKVYAVVSGEVMQFRDDDPISETLVIKGENYNVAYTHIDVLDDFTEEGGSIALGQKIGVVKEFPADENYIVRRVTEILDGKPVNSEETEEEFGTHLHFAIVGASDTEPIENPLLVIEPDPPCEELPQINDILFREDESCAKSLEPSELVKLEYLNPEKLKGKVDIVVNAFHNIGTTKDAGVYKIGYKITDSDDNIVKEGVLFEWKGSLPSGHRGEDYEKLVDVIFERPYQHLLLNQLEKTDISTSFHYMWYIVTNTDNDGKIESMNTPNEDLYECWDTTKVDDGRYTVTITAWDAQGKSESKPKEVVVKNRHILPVPYFNQGNRPWCILNSAAMVLQYYGISDHAWDLAHEFDIPHDSGLFIDPLHGGNRRLKDYIESKGLGVNIQYIVPFMQYEEEDLFHLYVKNPINRGSPVIFESSSDEHAIVLVGYSIINGERYVYVHDPSGSMFTDEDNMFIMVPHHDFWVKLIPTSPEKLLGVVIIEATPAPPHPVIYFNEDNEWLGCDINHSDTHSEVPEVIESYLYLDKGLKWITSHSPIPGFPEIEPGSHYLRWKNSNIINLNRIVASNPSLEPVTISVRIILKKNNQIEFEGTTEEIDIESESQTVTIKDGNGNIPDITFPNSGSKELYLKAYLDGQIVDEIGPIIINVVDPSCFWGSAACPVDVSIIDPDGFVLSKQLNDIPEATYSERDLNDDDDPDDMFIIPGRKIGDYAITVIPEPDAEPTDTYTLEVSAGDTTIVLAEDISISKIPDQPYIIESTEEDIIDRTPPTASFTHSPGNPVVNQTITFNATSSTGNISSYEWDFSDGNTTVTPCPIITHSYAEAGAYTVTLTVTDDDGLTSTTSRTVTVIGILGDLNHDGILTPADAAIALQLAATGGWDPAADVNHDNRITSLDALMILQAAGGAISL